MTTIIDTSTSIPETATAYSNQRKIDRCQNGVLWAFRQRTGLSTSILQPYYSTDGGATWSFTSTVKNGSGTSAEASNTNASIFIDLDDYAHVVFKDNSNGYIYYRRGTPNAARTSWTWSNAFFVTGLTTMDHPDIVAHREGSDWRVHIVASRITEQNNDKVHYWRLDVTSGGSISFASGIEGDGITIGGGYDITTHKYPSIDFHHTEDAKTVKDGAPHLFVAWSAGGTGSGAGIRFKKATYSSGSWTWGTEREIDSTQYVSSNLSYWVNCLFDGNSIIIGGTLTGTDETMILYERDVADTMTSIVASQTFNEVYGGSFSYDQKRNVYFVGFRGNDTFYYIYNRETDALEGPIFDSTTTKTRYVSVKRGYSDNSIEFIYTDGTSSPYDVTYGSISLNTAPDTPTNLAVTSDSTDTTPTFEVDVNDPNSGDEVKARFELSTGAGSTVGTVDSRFTITSGTVTAEYATALSLGEYRVRAKAIDAAGEESSYTAYVDFDILNLVSPKDLVLKWDLRGAVSKDLITLWNVNIANQKDFILKWGVKQPVDLDLTLRWWIKTPWNQVTESDDIWTKVNT